MSGSNLLPNHVLAAELIKTSRVCAALGCVCWRSRSQTPLTVRNGQPDEAHNHLSTRPLTPAP
ncbi:hypothetical protein J5X98_08180 [Leptothermofonsia sichuanensis E412]|uniref:hypothetical protein n=1 Tax=Leptothermofonsia sichuanensis TaxID=2917832 RepID=UPI001CA784CB|nr:hypothetical protein [Leptothermofonsia sichuanensis]QZZ22343.1 hypothetical protein J5X98_08180 [Leptothermofonsia sichuanensis E412]